ncbi:MAG: hypothetical protein JSR27_01415, partial [Proteobacteria bacterium]|nr:hypothetical protein [Pseudomonadota bacterium]
FSLGIVLFECLAGRMPFTDESPLGLMLEVVKAEIPDVRTLNSEVDPELERILSKMVAKDPADRYQSCQDLVADLGRHPLVAKGGPITLQTRMSTAAATVVGGKTPVSGQRPLPNTSPTPQPLPVSRPTPAAQPAMGAHQPVLQPQTAKSSPMLPLAIAAILILGLVGGAWAFRDRIPALQQLLGAGSATVATTTNAPTPSTPAAPIAQQPAAAPPPTATPATASETLSATATQAPTDPRYAENAASTASPTTIPPTPAPPTEAPATPAMPAAAPAVAPPPVQVASVAQPPKPTAPPKPHVPTIAILASGDDAISTPAEEALERALAHNGYRIVDEGSLPRVGRFMDAERPRFAEAVQALRGHADAVVFVHARKVGAQEMNYYGQSSTLYTAQLAVRAYAIEQARPLGPPWSEQVNFTSLNAAEKAHEAVEPMLERVSERLIDYKPGKRRE